MGASRVNGERQTAEESLVSEARDLGYDPIWDVVLLSKWSNIRSRTPNGTGELRTSANKTSHPARCSAVTSTLQVHS